MRVPRLYVDTSLTSDSICLEETEAHYLGRVLRLKPGDRVVLFNGRGEERVARVETVSRRQGALRLLEPVVPLPESGLDLILLQALIKAEAMDFVIQKATELGVRTIWPIETEFSVVKLGGERGTRRLEHWTRKSRSACEQSGRHRPARIESPAPLADALRRLPAGHLRLVLQPGAAAAPAGESAPVTGVCVLAGPEGGLSELDLAIIDAAGFARLSLGPRTLRAETAAVAGCVLAQARWGDLR